MSKNHGSLHLFKQNLKFSSAHFLIFDQTRAEMLHGHNYQVQIDVEFKPHENIGQSEQGYYFDFSDLKIKLKALVDEWDEHVLLPKNHPDIRVQNKDAKTLEVFFRDRYYAFPQNEVILLPITNTSVELLSEHLSSKLSPFFRSYPVTSFEVRVEETPGQGASFRRYL